MRLELHARGPQILTVGPADVVVGHGSDETGGAAQFGDPGRRIGHRTPRDVAGGAHGFLHGIGGRQVDEGHRALLQADLGQLFVRDELDDVEQGRSDGHDVEVVPCVLGGDGG